MPIDIDQITQLSPPVALAAALWVLGVGLKRSPVPDWLIPFLLPIAGAIAFPFIADTSEVNFNVKSPAMFHAVIGFCIGGASVAMNEAAKQFTNRKDTPP